MSAAAGGRERGALYGRGDDIPARGTSLRRHRRRDEALSMACKRSARDRYEFIHAKPGANEKVAIGHQDQLWVHRYELAGRCAAKFPPLSCAMAPAAPIAADDRGRRRTVARDVTKGRGGGRRRFSSWSSTGTARISRRGGCASGRSLRCGPRPAIRSRPAPSRRGRSSSRRRSQGRETTRHGVRGVGAIHHRHGDAVAADGDSLEAVDGAAFRT